MAKIRTTASGSIEIRTARLEVKLYPTERAAVDRVALGSGFTTASDYVRHLITVGIGKYDLIKRGR